MPNNHKKTVLVTGGASGIGLSTAEAFAKADYRVIITDIDEQALQRAMCRFNGNGADVHPKVVDVASREQVQALAEWVASEVGALDVLVNNAGVGHHGELAETSLDTWKKLLDVNFWGPLYHVYAFLPAMKRRAAGLIINVSSGQAFFRLPTWGAYASIKAALGVFSEILHFELRKHGITVITVYPFMVNTPFYREIEGETWAGKLSMKLVPYYSMTPEKVGRIIFRAAERHKKVEKVSVINSLGHYMQLVPFVGDVMARATTLLLAK